jgi:hypothetical protein
MKNQATTCIESKDDETDVLYIRSCPVGTKAELRRIAKLNRRSMEAQAIVFIEEGARRFAVDKEAREILA